MLKKIEDKTKQLLDQAAAIVALKDQLYELYYDASIANSTKSQPTDLTHRKQSFQLARSVNDQYRAWYATAFLLVRANLKERNQEFEQAYGTACFHLVDLVDARADPSGIALAGFDKSFSTQTGIVRAIPDAIEAQALALRGILARDLMDDELAASKHLLDNGYVREAGVIVGIVLERHLKLLCDKRGVVIGKKDTLGQLNDKLRQHYPDEAEYRRVQFFNEIRISCAHDKSGTPDPNKVGQLLSGVQGFIAAIT